MVKTIILLDNRNTSKAGLQLSIIDKSEVKSGRQYRISATSSTGRVRKDIIEYCMITGKVED